MAKIDYWIKWVLFWGVVTLIGIMFISLVAAFRGMGI